MIGLVQVSNLKELHRKLLLMNSKINDNFTKAATQTSLGYCGNIRIATSHTITSNENHFRKNAVSKVKPRKLAKLKGIDLVVTMRLQANSHPRNR